MSTVASLVAAKLLKIKAIKLNPTHPFTWASGLKSPVYCDNRITLSHPEIRDFIKQSLNDKLWAFGEADVIAGVATAGIPHGALLADISKKPFVYVRSKSKAHGRQNKIEGELAPGSKVLVVEDLISTGMSSIAACEALQEAGAEVIGVLALFTYGLDKSKQVFKDYNIPLETLTNYRVLLEEAKKSDYISTEEKALLEDWNKDPVAWSEKAQKRL